MNSFAQVLDLFLPPRCVSCGKIVTEHNTLCSLCWQVAPFIHAPMCQCCGRPFTEDVPATAICLDCAQRRPPFHQARTVFAYDEFARKMVLSFKHGDRCDLAPILARWMIRAGPDLIANSDLIIPVPLHWLRLFRRRYNQAALLAHEISKQSGLPVQAQALKRVRPTRPQGHLSRLARQQNLKGAFTCSLDLTDKTVLLIDDVLTTGTTVLNCTRELHRAGAKAVNILTIARVFHPHSQ
ncbi:double zinc ribbon domain-containing protein [Terasakiella pusilla]|uniref:double zinc ribbon domain-containing protein n=1 Tax=Terasakiella pusilla TaxID=64973 RepID=UPI003AA8F2F2